LRIIKTIILVRAGYIAQGLIDVIFYRDDGLFDLFTVSL